MFCTEMANDIFFLSHMLKNVLVRVKVCKGFHLQSPSMMFFSNINTYFKNYHLSCCNSSYFQYKYFVTGLKHKFHL